MKLGVCITTRNRPKQLRECLSALWSSSQKPDCIVVSDDSSSQEVASQNAKIVESFRNTQYLVGRQLGVCANRNNALAQILKEDIEFVAFVDDDIQVHADYIENFNRYFNSVIPEEKRRTTILTGMILDAHGETNTRPVKLSFRGYFQDADAPEAVCSPSAIYPVEFLKHERWDENIFFGYEDAELCLRAIRSGYQIVHCPELQVSDAGELTVLKSDPSKNTKLEKHEIYIEAARLYVGFKRFKTISPNYPKLLMFLAIYFSHMSIYLARRGGLRDFIIILKMSNISTFFGVRRI
jgi:GT2 family glycosyltransferase